MSTAYLQPVTESSGTAPAAYLDAISRRDARFDGVFVYGVKTTRIFCRPSCPSRTAKPENTLVFSGPAAAAGAGFRACLRCAPDAAGVASPDVQIVARACELVHDSGGQPRVGEIARRCSISHSALVQTFRRVLGITPSQYIAAWKQDAFRAALRVGEPVTTAVYGAGYGSASRVYENADNTLGMTPGHYRQGGTGQRIDVGIAPSDFGFVLAARTARGICAVHLGDSRETLLRSIRSEFPQADVVESNHALTSTLDSLLQALDGTPTEGLALDIQGTAFQRRVWEALQAIPYAETSTYAQVAEAIGKPLAARAVARACAANRVALIVPCHRVVPASGGSGGYRWGSARKAAILDHERSA